MIAISSNWKTYNSNDGEIYKKIAVNILSCFTEIKEVFDHNEILECLPEILQIFVEDKNNEEAFKCLEAISTLKKGSKILIFKYSEKLNEIAVNEIEKKEYRPLQLISNSLRTLDEEIDENYDKLRNQFSRTLKALCTILENKNEERAYLLRNMDTILKFSSKFLSNSNKSEIYNVITAIMKKKLKTEEKQELYSLILNLMTNISPNWMASEKEKSESFSQFIFEMCKVEISLNLNYETKPSSTLVIICFNILEISIHYMLDEESEWNFQPSALLNIRNSLVHTYKSLFQFISDHSEQMAITSDDIKDEERQEDKTTKENIVDPKESPTPSSTSSTPTSSSTSSHSQSQNSFSSRFSVSEIQELLFASIRALSVWLEEESEFLRSDLIDTLPQMLALPPIKLDEEQNGSLHSISFLLSPLSILTVEDDMRDCFLKVDGLKFLFEFLRDNGSLLAFKSFTSPNHPSIVECCPSASTQNSLLSFFNILINLSAFGQKDHKVLIANSRFSVPLFNLIVSFFPLLQKYPLSEQSELDVQLRARLFLSLLSVGTEIFDNLPPEKALPLIDFSSHFIMTLLEKDLVDDFVGGELWDILLKFFLGFISKVGQCQYPFKFFPLLQKFLNETKPKNDSIYFGKIKVFSFQKK